MRIGLTALIVAAAFAPVPALAAPGEAARITEELNDPVRQERLATAAEAMASAVLDMPAGPLMRAAKTMAGEDADYIDPDLRVGDLVNPETADAPYQITHRLPQMMGAIAGAAAALELMIPELRAMGDRIAEDMARDIYE